MDTLHFPTSQFSQYFKDNVYEPAEDTFLLLDAIEKDIEEIKNQNPLIVIEIGVGSGAVIGSLIRAINNPTTIYLGTDVNQMALDAAQLAMSVNNFPIGRLDLIRSNLIPDGRLDNAVDLLIFNPPYVITDDAEIPTIQSVEKESVESVLSASWAGGMNGMVITSKFLQLIPRLLSDEGRFYLVLIKENGIDNILGQLSDAKIDAKITMERKCGSEHLFVITGKKRR